MLEHWAKIQPDKKAYIWLGSDGEIVSEHTYGSLLTTAEAFADRLRAEGLQRGDRAILICDHSMEFLEALWGCLFAGVIAVPMPAQKRNRKSDRVDTIVTDCQAAATIQGGEIKRESANASPQSLSDVIILQYTSGSTSAPKGVCITNECLLANMVSIKHLMSYHHEIVQVCWLPLYHDMGLIGSAFEPIYNGATHVFLSPTNFLRNPILWLKAISQFRGSLAGAPNFAYDLCAERITEEEIDTLDLSSLEVLYSGAEPIRAGTLSRFERKFARAGFKKHMWLPCFGMAESTLMFTGSHEPEGPAVLTLCEEKLRLGVAEPDSEGKTFSVSCGKPSPGHRIAIADPDTLANLPEMTVGEVWLQGPSIAEGYWNKPEVNREIFAAHLATGEGPFLRTGDLGFLENGNLHISGRLKDLIIVGGKNHYPHDIELTVENAHSAINPAGVAAFPTEGESEQVVVVAELRRNAVRDETAPIFDAILRAVASEHELAVASIVLIKPMSLPKTTSGKVRRKETRRALGEGDLDIVARHGIVFDQVAQPATRDEKVLVAEILEVIGDALRRDVSPIGAGKSLGAVGIDSMQAMEVLIALEKRFGIHLSDGEITPEITATEIAGLVTSRRNGNHRAPVLSTPKQVTNGASAPGKRSMTDFFDQPFSDSDMFARCEEFGAFLAEWKATASYGFFSVRSESKGTEVNIQTPRSAAPRKCISFAGYDYLGLSWQPEVIAAAQKAAGEYGISPTGTPPLSGLTRVHQELQEFIAGLLQQEDCILFSNAFAANVGTINALLRDDDLIVADMLSHASLYDGMDSAKGTRRLFHHNRVDHMSSILASERSKYAGLLVVTEGLFSMDGDTPPLVEIIAQTKPHGGRILIDEAHSFGVIGPTGLGTVERYSAFNQVDLIIGSLGKAPGGGGGFVAGSRSAIAWIRHFARPGIFSGGPSPCVAAATLRALQLQREQPELLDSLRRNISLFRQGLRSIGIQVSSDEESPIIPVVIGDDEKLGVMNEVLLDEGIFTSPVIFPAVAKGASRFRFSISARHTRIQIEKAIAAISKAHRLHRPAPQPHHNGVKSQ